MPSEGAGAGRPALATPVLWFVVDVDRRLHVPAPAHSRQIGGDGFWGASAPPGNLTSRAQLEEISCTMVNVQETF